MGAKLGPLFLFPEELDILQRSSIRPSLHLEEDFGAGEQSAEVDLWVKIALLGSQRSSGLWIEGRDFPGRAWA